MASVTEQEHDDHLNAVGSLADPVRRALYELVVERGGGVGRDEAGTSVGVSRSLAAYHLDRLVDDGLLTARYERRGAARGPGQGRPSKVYDRAAAEVQVSLPPRDYELPARLLAQAFEDSSAPPRAALVKAARQLGHEIGAEAAQRAGNRASARRLHACLRDVLRERGYEPFDDDDGVMRLRNCPFHALAQEHRQLVCGMNLEVVSGIVAALGVDVEARLEPRVGLCCVAIGPE
jgi:predicted ArsR family transcriptional regulator